jgi:glycosyltransferase involved in cell wall biosynthesis
MPRVSVIVPAYNAAWCVGEAVESIVAQTYSDWEAIVVDDGSTDDTSAVARGRDPRIRVVRSDVNRGLAASRNAGLAAARGELVALLDADDAWLPEYLESQVGLQERTGAEIVCCDALLLDGKRLLDETYADRFGPPDADGPITAASLLRANRIFISVLLEREAVAQAGGFDASLRSVEDLDLWLRMLENGDRVAYQRRPLAVYRLSVGSLSRDTLTMTRARQAVITGALARGRLDPVAVRAARRQLRLQRAAETVELARRERGARAAARVLGAAPLLARVAAERVVDR